jgi:hypothetical protein
MRREDVDFSAAVPYAHEAMDKRLRDWARWCRPKKGGYIHPMWRGMLSSNAFEVAVPSIPLNTLDAHEIEKGVRALPEQHAFAVRWAYVYGGNPRKAAQHAGETVAGLDRLVNDGRQMLINRKV